MENVNYIDFEKLPYLLGYLRADNNSKAMPKVMSAAVCDPNSPYERAVVLLEERTVLGSYFRVVVENARTMHDYDFDTEEEAYARCVLMGVEEPSTYVLGFGFNDAACWEVLPNDPIFDVSYYEHLF